MQKIGVIFYDLDIDGKLVGRQFISKELFIMNKTVFKGLQKLVGIYTSFEADQRAFNFVLVGARKACLITTPIKCSPLFNMAFDVYEVYPETAPSMGENWEEMYNYVPLKLIVKKGTDVSHVIFEKDGKRFFRHLEMGIILGFPPEECQEFHTIQERIGVNYYGLQFACEKNRLASAVAYLEKTFSLPQWMKDESEFVTR